MTTRVSVAQFGRIHLAGRTDGVTRLELFVDLVFVYAFLNVTGVTAEQLNPAGVPRGLLLLLLLWWCWVHYAWLGNAVRLGRGVLPAVTFALAATLFVMALTVREAFVDRPGGLDGPLVFAVGYLVARGGPLLMATLALRRHPRMRRQFRRVWPPALAGMALILAAALLPGAAEDREVREWARFGLVALAIAVEYGGVLAAGTGGWRLRSTRYWAERHSLVILIGFGETIISVGLSQGAAVAQPLTWSVVIGVLVSVVLIGALWWTYFDIARFAAEQALERARGARRILLARDAYSFLHLPMIAGLILVSLGLKYVLGQLRLPSDSPSPFGVLVLYGGVALYLSGLLLFELRSLRIVGRSPLLGMLVTLGLIPVATGLPALGQLALLVVAVGTMTLADVTVFRHRHRRLHAHVDPAAAADAGVTPKELFLDLVFVYAFLQVAALMADDPTWSGLLRGLLVLSVLWAAWCAYVWLAAAVRSEARAARVVVLLVVAVTALISITVPQAFSDATGGLSGPLVFVTCYAVIRFSQLGALWLIAQRDGDRERRAKVLAAVLPTSATLTVLLGAALLPYPVGDIRDLPAGRAALWLAAIAIDYGGVLLAGSHRWRIWSPAHWSDRYCLIIIIGLGQAVISMGAAVAYTPVSGRIVIAATLGTALLGTLWWVYFGRDAAAGEHALAAREGIARTRLARDAYPYLHLPMIAGIVLVSVGLGKTMARLGAQGLFVPAPPLFIEAHLALFGGVLLYLLADAAFWWRVTGRLRPWRLGVALTVAALTPLSAGLSPLAALTALLGVCLVLVGAEASGIADSAGAGQAQTSSG